MEPSIDKLLEQASSGAINKETLRWLLIPEEERQILARAALVHAFDEHLLEAVLSAGVTKVPLSQLAESPLVERLPSPQGFFCVRESVRQAQIQQWSGKSTIEDGVSRSRQEFDSISHALADYYARLGPEWQGERLYHLWAAKPDEARKLFNELFTEAERRFDVARCHDLLERLSERIQELPYLSELHSLLEDYTPRLEARSLWSEEYYRSARFHERPKLLHAVEQLLEDSPTWILQLFATGGLGKTSFIWWLIARYFVPRGIPCARIDFDHVRSGADEPWRLFLQLATQLKLQLRGTGLMRLESELSRYGQEHSQSTVSAPEGFSHEMASWFASALQDSGHQAPVVIIFDTVEEALLHRGTALVTLLEHLEMIRKSFPRLRVILSGRYDLAERLEGLRQLFGPAMISLEVQRFNEDEAHAYLTHRRGFTAGDPRVGAVMRKAQGVPFKLSLLADHVQRTGAAAEEIDAYPAADMLYLVKRVVERIEDPQVRWLLRYGVIPRNLTFSFVEEVMARHLPDAMAGSSTEDDPREDKLPTQPFRTDLLQSAQEPVNLLELWQKLTRYASDHGWVRRVLGTPETLVFHKDVVNPMRRLLQKQGIFFQLHREAVELYVRKAEGPRSPQWIGAILEAVYHRFQLEGMDAEPFWLEQLQLARAAKRADWRKRLAKEVLSSDYLDPDGKPYLRQDGKPMLSATALLEANLELSEVALETLSETRERRQQLQEARDAIDWAMSLQKGSDVRLAIMNARITLEEGHAHQVAAILDAALKLRPSPLHEFQLRMIEADARSATGEDCVDALGAMPKLVGEIPSQERPAACLWLSRRLSAWDLHADAINAASLVFQDSSDEVALQALVPLAEAYLLAGQPFRAGSLLEKQRISSTDFRLLKARVSLEQGDAETALRDLELVKGKLSSQGTPSELSQLALTNQLIAAAHAKQLDFDRATEFFTAALDLWRMAGEAKFFDRCLREYVAVLVHDMEDRRTARQVLGQAKTRRSDSLEVEGTRLDLFGVRLQARGNSGAALSQLASLTQRSWQPPPSLWVEVALEGLALAEAPETFLPLLEKNLAKVQTVSARLALLRPLRHVKQLRADAAQALLQELPLEENLHPGDYALALMWRAELYRFVKDPRAREDLKRVESYLVQANTGLQLWRELLLLQDRLGVSPEDRASPPKGLLEAGRSSPVKLLGALLLEEAERKLQLKRWPQEISTSVQELMASAQRYLRINLPSKQGQLLENAQSRLRTLMIEANDSHQLHALKTTEEPRGVHFLDLPQFSPVPDFRPEGTVRILLLTDPMKRAAWDLGGFPFDAPRISHELVSRFAKDWLHSSRELGDTLEESFAKQYPYRVKSLPSDLRLLGDPVVHALPWELALSSLWELPLGLQPSVRTLCRDVTMEPRSILETVLPPSQGKSIAVISHPAAAGRLRRYTSPVGWGRRLFSLDERHGMDELMLLHLCGEMADGPVFSLGQSGHRRLNTKSLERAPEEVLTPTALASKLRGSRPTVILDIDRPVGLTDLMRQILLRNLFAAQLFSLGVCSAVLCTGLAEQKHQHEIDDLLVESLLNGESLGTISQLLRQRGVRIPVDRNLEGIAPEEILGPATTALFASDPGLRPFAEAGGFR